MDRNHATPHELMRKILLKCGIIFPTNQFFQLIFTHTRLLLSEMQQGRFISHARVFL
jgi:hypothetical protein